LSALPESEYTHFLGICQLFFIKREKYNSEKQTDSSSDVIPGL